MHYIVEHGCYRVLNISHFSLMSVKPLSLSLSLSLSLNLINCFVPLVGIIFGGVIEAVTTFIAYEFIRIANIT